MFPAIFCVCPKTEPGLPIPYVMVYLLSNDLRWEVIVHFVDIVEIIDHHCWNFLFIMLYNKSYLIDENKNKSQFLSNLFRRNKKIGCGLWFMVFYATFNNISVISWRSVLLVEETGVPGENHRPVASHWQTLSHNVVSSTPCLSGIWTHNISGDWHWLHR